MRSRGWLTTPSSTTAKLLLQEKAGQRSIDAGLRALGGSASSDSLDASRLTSQILPQAPFMFMTQTLPCDTMQNE
jgi:hypothetical protein